MGSYCSTSSEQATPNTTRPNMHRPTTTAQVTPEEMNESFRGMAGVGLDAVMMTVFSMQDPELFAHLRENQIFEAWQTLEVMIASGDGELSDLEAQYIIGVGERWSPYLDTASLVEEARGKRWTEQDVAEYCDRIRTCLGGEEVTRHGGAWLVAAKVFPLCLLMYGICGAAQDGLTREELNVAYIMADKLELPRDAAREIVALVRQEQQLFGAIEAVLFGLDTSPDEKEDDAPGLPRATTVAGISPEEMDARYSGMAGVVSKAHNVKKLGGDPRAAAADQMWKTVAEKEPMFQPSFVSLVAIVAKGDGELSELEEKKLDDVCEFLQVDNSEKQISNIDPNKFDELMTTMKDCLDRLAPEMEAETSPVMWRALTENVNIQLLRIALDVAAQDGLARAEMDVVYRMADKLGVPRRVARQCAELLKQEQALVLAFMQFFGGGEMPPQ